MSFRTFAQNSQLNVGSVSHVTPRSVYVRFDNTAGLSAKDTLMVLINNQWTNALIVEMVSSKSCITQTFITDAIVVGNKVAYNKIIKEVKPTTNKIANEQNKIEKPIIVQSKKDSAKITTNALQREPEKSKKIKQTYNVRISVSTNGSMEESEKKYNRIRTSLNADVNNINGGKFSVENYFTYRRSFGNSLTPTSFNDDFKIYSLSLNYDANEKTSIAVGRRINNRMANMGAIDGVQAEYKYKKLIFGGFAGFRPDDMDYGFNSKLMQFGGVVAHEIDKGVGQIQTSVAFAEQKNNGNTDRRFIYMQHTNSIVKNLSLFYSLELDVFQNINNVISNKINLTSTYISLRYKPFKKMSLTASYDNRRNVIYYETYRTYIDQLLTQETRQGLRLNMNYNILKYLNFNASGFYRYQESRPQPTKNYVANLTLSQFMGTGSTFNINFNAMNTYYFNGNIYGARLTKDLFKSKLSTEVNYRKVDYKFVNPEQPNTKQDVLGVSLNTYGKKGASLMLSYEGTFEPNKKYNRYYVTFSQRFRSKK